MVRDADTAWNGTGLRYGTGHGYRTRHGYGMVMGHIYVWDGTRSHKAMHTDVSAEVHVVEEWGGSVTRSRYSKYYGIPYYTMNVCTESRQQSLKGCRKTKISRNSYRMVRYRVRYGIWSNKKKHTVGSAAAKISRTAVQKAGLRWLNSSWSRPLLQPLFSPLETHAHGFQAVPWRVAWRYVRSNVLAVYTDRPNQ